MTNELDTDKLYVMVLMGSFQLEIIYDKKDPLYFCLLYLQNSMFKSIMKGLNVKQKKM